MRSIRSDSHRFSGIHRLKNWILQIRPSPSAEAGGGCRWGRGRRSCDTRWSSRSAPNPPCLALGQANLLKIDIPKLEISFDDWRNTILILYSTTNLSTNQWSPVTDQKSDWFFYGSMKSYYIMCTSTSSDFFLFGLKSFPEEKKVSIISSEYWRT